MATLYNKYIINIYERYLDLKNSNKQVFDNYDLSKIFEYYSCLKLTDEYKKQFYEYDDIDPTFKEDNQMSRNDTGIDCSDLDKTIVQCKLRKTSLTWTECSTFFASQNLFNNELNKATVRWNNLIITRNSDSTLSDNLLVRRRLFIDKPYDRQEMVQFCENLVANPPAYPIVTNDFTLRDYQIESINMIKQNKKNVIVNLPTGTGKNSVIIYSFEDNKKYLILVPRIILMDQLQDEIIKHKPLFKNKIQLIGDSNNTFVSNKNITICVFNSVSLIESHCSTFEKIYVDEAHHINKPEIYCYDDEPIYGSEEEVKEDSNEESEESDESEYDESDEAEEETDEDLKDDSEDELRNVKTYNQIIKSLIQHDNNVYLSATIDKIDEFEYYSKDIRQMIERGFLCDYTIHIPIFSEDPDNRKICDHLLRNYRNIIIYCNSQKEGKEINRLMNELQNNSCMYIDCNTSKKNRDIITNKYKNSELQFLVNVRILVEGFDAPITKGVCFLHLPKNRTTLIQIIGRALRLHATKTIANIILPFSSKEDEKNICNFLKVMAQNDSRIKKSFESKKLGGYISIEKAEDDTDNEATNENIEFKYNMIYDSMGRLTNGEEIWMKRLEDVKRYIDNNNKRPQIYKPLGKWLSHQITNYNRNINSMKNNNIKHLFIDFLEQYKQYFLSNEEEWEIKFTQLIDFININKTKPKQNTPIYNWLRSQIQNYKRKRYIMKNIMIYNKWTNFIEKYKIYLLSTEDIFINNLEEIKIYIKKYNKKPQKNDKSPNVSRMASWICSNQRNYIEIAYCMKNKNIYDIWSEFQNEYKEYIFTLDDKWLETLNKVKLYIKTNKIRPSEVSKDIEVSKLGSWVQNQFTNYKKCIKCMNNNERKIIWEQFINEYEIYFLSNNQIWMNTFENVKFYINEHKKRPSCTDKDIEIAQLGRWLVSQTKNYKNKSWIMKDEMTYNMWKNFINDDRYSEHFLTDSEKWINSFDKLKSYIDIHDKTPSSVDKDINIKCLGVWLLRNKKMCINKTGAMNDVEIYNKWNEFMNNDTYNKYFITEETKWLNKLEITKQYINTNNKKPSKRDNDINIKNIGEWLSHQITNYRNKINSMKDPVIQHQWYNFITNSLYSQYFDQDIALPDPLPDAEQSNSPLDEFHQIEIREVVSKKDIKDEINNISAITSILNRYENKMNIDNSSIQERLDGRPKRRNKVNRQEMFQE